MAKVKKTPQQQVDVAWKEDIIKKAHTLCNEFGKSGVAVTALGYISQNVNHAMIKSFEQNPLQLDDSFAEQLISAMQAHLPVIVKGAYRVVKIDNAKEIKNSKSETKDRAERSKAVIDALIFHSLDADNLFDNKYLLNNALRAKLDMILRELIQQNVEALTTQLSIAITALHKEALEALWGKDEYNVTLADILEARVGKNK